MRSFWSTVALVSPLAFLLWIAACGSNTVIEPEEGVPGDTGGTATGSGGGRADAGTGGKGNTGGGSTGSGGRSTGSGGGSTGSGGGSTGSGGGSTGTGGGTIPGTGLPPPGCGSGNVAGGPRWVGRVDATNVNAVEFAWQGAGLVANVTGTDIAVKLSANDEIYFQPVVDGVPKPRFAVSGSDQTVTLASGLAAGDHVIELYRDTEGTKGSSTFLGFTNGTVTGACATNDRLIEIVGDSISAGYGNLGSEAHPGWSCGNACCHWTAENSTWFQTYGALAGHQLNAEVSTIAASGWGLGQDRGCGTGSLVPNVYENTVGTGGGGTWGFNPKAAAVIVNLGTNDMACGSFSTATYTAAGIAFAQKIRSHYPNAWIFFTIGSMSGSGDLAKIKPAQDAIVAGLASDTKIATFQFPAQNMGSNGEIPTGCDWHPSLPEHAKMATQLKTQLQAKLGW